MKKVLLFLMILVAILSITACSTEAETPNTDIGDEKPNHSHTSDGKYIVIKNPTCTKEGVAEIFCTECGEAITVPVPKKEHIAVAIPAVESTCTETGLTEGKRCKVCDTILVAQQEVPLKPHTEVTIPAVDQTCTETGLSEGKYCSVCYNILVKPEVVGEHHWVDFVCSDCGEKHVSTGLRFSSNGDGTCYVSGIGTCTDKDIGIPSISPAGDTVTSIGSSVFEKCRSIRSVYIPNTMEFINTYAFKNCENLASVTFEEESNLELLTIDVFRGCSSLSSITLPDSLKSIGTGAFKDCTSLDSIIIPEGVTSIYADSFSGCTSLTNITIPNSVTGIGQWAFYNCTSLNNVTIPESITSIALYAFYRCTSLTSINIPDGVTSIGNGAFEYCSSLTSITMSSAVTSIGIFTFYHCTALTSITIPDSVTSIDETAFRGCTSLTSVTIPDSVTSIGEYAFFECKSLTAINFNGTVEQWSDVSLGVHWNSYVPATYVQCSDGTVPLK